MRLRRVVRDAYVFIAAASIILYAACMFGNEFLVGIFVAPGTELFAMASGGLRIFATRFLVRGIQPYDLEYVHRAFERWHFRTHLYTAQFRIRAHLLDLVLDVMGYNGRVVRSACC